MLKARFKRKYIYFYLSLVIFLGLAGFNQHAHAQQTIINVPSSELLPEGDLILKNSTRVKPFSNTFSSSITPSVTIGTGFGTQFSTAVETAIGNETIVGGDISAKKVWFIGNSTRLTAGGTISPYFNQNNHPDSFVYTHLSQRIKKTKTSLTAGIYMNGQNRLPDNFGVLLGVEQVLISNKLRFAMDWLSTPDSYGRIGAGLKYRPVPTLSVTASVIIPNKESDNLAFNVSISKFISLDKENPIKRRLTNVD